MPAQSRHDDPLGRHRLLLRDRAEQILERLGEGGDALLDQRIGDLVDIDPQPFRLGVL